MLFAASPSISAETKRPIDKGTGLELLSTLATNCTILLDTSISASDRTIVPFHARV